jgi:hypothetical protein
MFDDSDIPVVGGNATRLKDRKAEKPWRRKKEDLKK